MSCSYLTLIKWLFFWFVTFQRNVSLQRSDKNNSILTFLSLLYIINKIPVLKLCIFTSFKTDIFLLNMFLLLYNLRIFQNRSKSHLIKVIFDTLFYLLGTILNSLFRSFISLIIYDTIIKIKSRSCLHDQAFDTHIIIYLPEQGILWYTGNHLDRSIRFHMP